MKHLMITFVFACAFIDLSIAQKSCSLTINYEFQNIEQGYDHPTKCLVYINDKIVKESEIHLESKKQSIKLSVPQGNQNIRVVMMSKYEEKWEEHIIENEYSTDCVVTDTYLFKKKRTMNIVFDLNQPYPMVEIE